MLPRIFSSFPADWRRHAGWLFAWAVGTAVTLGIMGQPKTTPLHIDEVYWIGSSYYFDLAFRQHEFAHADWSLLPARENPPGSKYTIGLALAAAGLPIATPDFLGVFYAFFARQPGGWGNETEQAKRAAVLARLDPSLRDAMAAGATAKMDTRILVAARWAMLGCAAVCSLTVFLLGGLVGRRVLALVASQVVLLPPVAVEAYNYAMADAPAMCFSALAGAAVCLWAARWDGRSGRAFVIGGAVAGGLAGWACAAKMNALVVPGQAALIVIGLLGVALAGRDRALAGRVVAGGLAFGAAALVVFVAINPAIWRDPWGGLWAPYVEQQLAVELQAQFLGGYLGTVSERLAAVGAMTGLGAVGVVLVSGVALGGLFRRSWRQKAIACWWFCAVTAVTGWLPFARGRYVVPLVVPAVLVLLVGLDTVWDWIDVSMAEVAVEPGAE